MLLIVLVGDILGFLLDHHHRITREQMTGKNHHGDENGKFFHALEYIFDCPGFPCPTSQTSWMTMCGSLWFLGKVQSAISPPDHCVFRMKNTFGSPEIAALVSTSVKSPDALKTFETTGVH